MRITKENEDDYLCLLHIQLVELADTSSGDTVSQGFPAEMQQLVVAGVGNGNFGPADGRGKTLDVPFRFHKLYISSCTLSTLFIFMNMYVCFTALVCFAQKA